MTFNVKKPNRLLNRILKKTLTPYLDRRFNISYDDSAIADLKPPFVIVANHQTNWDAFILSCKIREPVSFVASAQQFRSAFMRFVMRLAGSIPKTKSMSDSSTVRGIFKIRNLSGVVGIFPEGKRNWDGATEEILYPTAKVLKQLKIPVVSVLFTGGTLTFPRWADSSRKGGMQLTYDILFNQEEIDTLPVDTLYQRLCQKLQHNEFQWQDQKRIPFKGKNLAQSLELCLFLCPQCGCVGKLHSAGDLFTCTSCGNEVRYNVYGFFENDGGNPPFKSVFEWNQWQLDEMTRRIRERLRSPGPPLLCDDHVFLHTAEPYGPLRAIGNGTLRFLVDRLEFESEGGQIQSFPFENLNGVSTHLSKWFDFYHLGDFYRVSFPSRHVSANKWSEVYDRLQGVLSESKE